MVSFLINFVSEIMLDLAFINLITIVTLSLKTRWKLIALVYFVAVSPFYLMQTQLPGMLDLPVLIMFSIIGAYLLWRNATLQAYSSFSMKLSSILDLSRPAKRAPKSYALRDVLATLHGMIIILIAVIPTVAGISFTISGFEIVQIPVVIGSVMSVVAISFIYYVERIKNEESKMKATLFTFFALTLILGLVFFSDIFLYLFRFFVQNFVYASVTAVMVISIPFLLADYAFNHFRKTLLLDRPRNLGKSLIKVYSGFIFATLLMTMIFSDMPLVYAFLAGQDVSAMLYWTFGFVFFAFSAARTYLLKILDLKSEAKLINETVVKDRTEKLRRLNLSL